MCTHTHARAQPSARSLAFHCLNVACCRLLGTPNESLWNGVSALPDYKTNFPKWQPRKLREVVQNPDRLNDAGIDLVEQMLSYTPNQRIVAKDALEHHYFDGLDLNTVGTIPLPF